MPSFRFVFLELQVATPGLTMLWEFHPPVELPLVVGTATHPVCCSGIILVNAGLLGAVAGTMIPIVSTLVAVENDLPPDLTVLVLVVDLYICYWIALGLGTIVVEAATVELGL